MGVGAALAASSRLDGLLEAIRPSPSSEFRRLTIAHYLCGVIKQCFQPNHQACVARHRPVACRLWSF